MLRVVFAIDGRAKAPCTQPVPPKRHLAAIHLPFHTPLKLQIKPRLWCLVWIVPSLCSPPQQQPFQQKTLQAMLWPASWNWVQWQ